jgi:hypothetical protein
MTPPIIFLDIDGVIVPDGDDASNTVFHPRCVEAFKSILVAVPGAKIDDERLAIESILDIHAGAFSRIRCEG